MAGACAKKVISRAGRRWSDQEIAGLQDFFSNSPSPSSFLQNTNRSSRHLTSPHTTPPHHLHTHTPLIIQDGIQGRYVASFLLFLLVHLGSGREGCEMGHVTIWFLAIEHPQHHGMESALGEMEYINGRYLMGVWDALRAVCRW